MAFQRFVRTIRDGEPVNAASTNRPIVDLLNNTTALKDALDAARAGAALYLRGVALSPLAVVGSPVYWDVESQAFAPAAPILSTDSAGNLIFSPAARVWGIVADKATSAVGDVLLDGVAVVDITPAIAAGETMAAGTWYLSTTPGKLTSVYGFGRIPILYATGSGEVRIVAKPAEHVLAHAHRHFTLEAGPAGDVTPPSPGSPHTITNADILAEGWLPANDAIFDGKAPTGAAFGYNISANVDLAAIWPPTPITNAVFLRNGAVVAPELLVADVNGIWWMTNCYGSVPWDTDLDTSASLSLSDPVCAEELPARMDLYLTEFAFLGDTTAVTRLVSTDPRIVITDASGSLTKDTGALAIRMALQMAVSGAPGLSTGVALSGYDDAAQVFDVSTVANGVYALSDNISLHGTYVTKTVGSTARRLYTGDVGIDINVAFYRELLAQTVSLNGVLEQQYSGVMFLSLPAGRNTAMRCKMQVPRTTDLVAPKLRIRIRILCTAAGTLPALTMTGRSIPAASALAELPVNDASITINTAVTATGAYQYVDVTSGPIDVAAGDDFFFTISRAGTGDNYGDVGIIRIDGQLTAE